MKDLTINIEECIFIENLFDQYIEDVNDSINETKEEMNEQDEDFEQYVRNLQFTFEYEEKINEANKIRNKIHTYCQRVFATPEWRSKLK